MALEAIRVLVGGFGDGDEGLVGRLLMIDTRAMRFETLRYAWDPDNPLSGQGARTRPCSRESVSRQALQSSEHSLGRIDEVHAIDAARIEAALKPAAVP